MASQDHCPALAEPLESWEDVERPSRMSSPLTSPVHSPKAQTSNFMSTALQPVTLQLHTGNKKNQEQQHNNTTGMTALPPAAEVREEATQNPMNMSPNTASLQVPTDEQKQQHVQDKCKTALPFTMNPEVDAATLQAPIDEQQQQRFQDYPKVLLRSLAEPKGSRHISNHSTTRFRLPNDDVELTIRFGTGIDLVAIDACWYGVDLGPRQHSFGTTTFFSWPGKQGSEGMASWKNIWVAPGCSALPLPLVEAKESRHISNHQTTQLQLPDIDVELSIEFGDEVIAVDVHHYGFNLVPYQHTGRTTAVFPLESSESSELERFWRPRWAAEGGGSDLYDIIRLHTTYLEGPIESRHPGAAQAEDRSRSAEEEQSQSPPADEAERATGFFDHVNTLHPHFARLTHQMGANPNAQPTALIDHLEQWLAKHRNIEPDAIPIVTERILMEKMRLAYIEGLGSSLDVVRVPIGDFQFPPESDPGSPTASELDEYTSMLSLHHDVE